MPFDHDPLSVSLTSYSCYTQALRLHGIGQVSASLSYKIEVNHEGICEDLALLPQVQHRIVNEVMSFTSYAHRNRPECSLAQCADSDLKSGLDPCTEQPLPKLYCNAKPSAAAL